MTIQAIEPTEAIAPTEAEGVSEGVAKPRYKLAMYWASACGGCDVAVLNLGMKLIEFTERWEPVFWPAAMDAKRQDVRAMEDGEIDVCLFDGGIRTDEDAEMAHLLRAKSKVLVAFGSCAGEGCIPGLANQRSIEHVFAAAYDPELNDVNGGLPNGPWESPYGELELPTLSVRLRTLGQVVDVDYSVPGCPPETERIAEVLGAVTAALDGTGPLPPKGAVLGAGNSTVCDECKRERGVKHITEFKRIQTLAEIDPTLCLLEQGLPCCGPATRDGCGAKCPAAGAPCIGCYGATQGVNDFGARLLSAYASVVDASEPEDIERILAGLPDTVGQFYRFSLAASLLHGGRS
ncbi:MAG TPA: oxidoreductase [Anaerolineae bacterium]|nr:oxidoreductase [Anaerolineae bacterium]